MKKLIEIEGKIAKRLDAQKFWATLVSEIPDTSFGAQGLADQAWEKWS